MMTFHEVYGALPVRLLRLYKKHNVSPADHDSILAAFDRTWQDASDMTAAEWERVLAFVNLNIQDGIFRLSRYV